MRAARVRPCPWRRPVRHLTAPEPGDTLRLAVFATHPRLGAYFHAEMLTVRSAMPALRSEEGGLHMLLRWADRPPRSTRGRPRFHMVFSELLLPRSVCTATHALHTHTPPPATAGLGFTSGLGFTGPRVRGVCSWTPLAATQAIQPRFPCVRAVSVDHRPSSQPWRRSPCGAVVSDACRASGPAVGFDV